MTSATSSSRAVVERYVAAVAAGDLDTVRDSFAEHATWWLGGSLPISGTWNGREAIIGEFLGAAMRHYEPGSVDLEVTSVVADGELVSVEWTSRARTVSGQPYENRCAGVFTVRDGRIHAVREYMDTAYAQQVAFAAA
jgi:uncharacterized protein (TIGR02246 family)